MGMSKERVNTERAIVKHAYFDLSHVSPLVFLHLLKECYSYGTCKATPKFRALQHQVHLVLLNNSHAGPATFIAQCLGILPIFDTFCEGFSHLVVSALRRFMKLGYDDDEDVHKAKVCASKLFLGTVDGNLAFEEGIIIKIIEAFDISLMDIETAISADCIGRNNSEAYSANKVIDQYICKLVDVKSYMTAVDLLIHFSIQESGEAFLLKMIERQQFKPAEKWATFMGKSALCLLVKRYADMKLLDSAYDVIKKNDLRQEFPELVHQSKESSLKKLAEKGVWEIAEARARGNRQLLEYLVYLALEAGYLEKVEELCARYSLKGFSNFKDSEANILKSRYLDLNELLIEEVVWVDEVSALREATCYFEECKVVGLDCEWKPAYEKGKPSKVSILQVASGKKVYIFDLIKLYKDIPSILDECLARILHSPSILKLGYNFQCDTKQLTQSYGDLGCFKQFEMLLDIQNVFNEPRGGLSGLSQKILGAALNKTRRNSNWEHRPLSQQQLEYAALDAAVLLHIFRHVGSHTQPGGAQEGNAKIEWKSHIVSHMKSSKVSKKKAKTGGD